MSFLYHIVPPRVVGDRLVPLNTLKHTAPTLYAQHMKKYTGREDVPLNRIPPLNCWWNDVVFLTAVHPEDLNKAYRDAGGQLKKRKFYRFDAIQFPSSETCVYLFTTNNKGPEDFKHFRAEDVPQYSELSPKTLAYYRRQIEEQQQVLVFAYVPHILFKGEISIHNATIITI